jgi:hypothetical protein
MGDGGQVRNMNYVILNDIMDTVGREAVLYSALKQDPESLGKPELRECTVSL